MKRIDIIVPAHNEEQVLERFYAALKPVIDALPYQFRIIFVDDGSVDRTAEVCRALGRCDARVGLLRLSRNFGHQAALTAGLDAADGDAVITMDADLQHPPSALPALVAAWEGGAEIVSGMRNQSAEVGFWKQLSSRVFYGLLNPLRIATWVGCVVAVLSVLYGLYAIAQVVVFRQAIQGWASLAVLVSFLSAAQLVTLGVFGEYLGQVLEEVRQRPLYIVAESSLGNDGSRVRVPELVSEVR